MSTTFESPPDTSGPRLGVTGWLWAAMGVLGALIVFTLYVQLGMRASIASKLEKTNEKLVGLESRTVALEERSADVRAQLAAASAKFEQTHEALDRARTLAERSRQDHRRLVQRLGGHIQEQVKEFGSLTGEVGAVKTEVADSRRDLQRAIGDLGEQSGLIAHNRQELEELKRLGEREYFEFDLAKAEGLSRVGPLSLRLNRTDTDRQKYTLTVLADDKQIEKKDKTLLEPVQFYLPGTRSLREIVVYEVADDRVAGYVSIPKELIARK
jgi:hypothetical protein